MNLVVVSPMDAPCWSARGSALGATVNEILNMLGLRSTGLQRFLPGNTLPSLSVSCIVKLTSDLG
jgi:hypothetical protein